MAEFMPVPKETGKIRNIVCGVSPDNAVVLLTQTDGGPQAVFGLPHPSRAEAVAAAAVLMKAIDAAFPSTKIADMTEIFMPKS